MTTKEEEEGNRGWDLSCYVFLLLFFVPIQLSARTRSLDSATNHYRSFSSLPPHSIRSTRGMSGNRGGKVCSEYPVDSLRLRFRAICITCRLVWLASLVGSKFIDFLGRIIRRDLHGIIATSGHVMRSPKPPFCLLRFPTNHSRRGCYFRVGTGVGTTARPPLDAQRLLVKDRPA